MLKILDVSNSTARPNTRGLGGPVENDIVRYLKKYAKNYNCEFVTSELNADIIFTNDVFPKEYNKPKAKRMDGVYSRVELITRNELLNNAAIQSDVVIFISKFSKDSLELLYPEIKLKKSKVVLNAVDSSEFFNLKLKKEDSLSLISTANSWTRPEKRCDIILDLAKEYKNINFNLIGNVDFVTPLNIKKLGYIENYQKLNFLLNCADGFIYLGFADPAPKTVCQALNCNLPMLLTNSGGNMELAKDLASYVNDCYLSPMFHNVVPKLNIESVFSSFDLFVKTLEDKRIAMEKFNNKENFETMLEGYFNTFKEVV